VNRVNPGTIEEIEGVREPDPGPEDTTIVRRCVILRRKPLAEFTTEDLRILLGQRMAVPTLLPMAVAALTTIPSPKATTTPAICSMPCCGFLTRTGTALSITANDWLTSCAKRRYRAKTPTPTWTAPSPRSSAPRNPSAPNRRPDARHRHRVRFREHKIG
jgi:CDI immunity proteins